jgi:hypothetical protein
MKNNLNDKIEYDLKFCFSLKESLKIMTFYEIFYMPYKRWIDLIKRKIDIKIEKCIENEKSDVLTEITKFSSSSVEVCYCFTQAILLWKLIEWPDYSGAKMYCNELVECLSRACIRYATQVKENNANFVGSLQHQIIASGLNSPNSIHQQQFNSLHLKSIGKTNIELDPYQKLIITTNNLERVRESLKSFLVELDYSNYLEKLSISNNSNCNLNNASPPNSKNSLSSNGNYLETLIESSSDYLLQINDITFDIIIINNVRFKFDFIFFL